MLGASRAFSFHSTTALSRWHVTRERRSASITRLVGHLTASSPPRLKAPPAEVGGWASSETTVCPSGDMKPDRCMRPMAKSFLPPATDRRFVIGSNCINVLSSASSSGSADDGRENRLLNGVEIDALLFRRRKLLLLLLSTSLPPRGIRNGIVCAISKHGVSPRTSPSCFFRESRR